MTGVSSVCSRHDTGLRGTATQVTYLRSRSPPADILYTPRLHCAIRSTALRPAKRFELPSSGGVIRINVLELARVNALLHFNFLTRQFYV